MSAKSIRAGAAYVEMVLRDEQLQKQMAALKPKFLAMGATIKAIGAESFTAMNSAATAAMASTAASSGIVSSALGAVSAATGMVASGFARIGAIVTSSVATAATSLGGLSLFASRLFPNQSHPFRKLLDGFLSNSQIVEATGRVTRLAGMVTGSRLLGDLGTRIQRLGMGAALAHAFRSAPILGGLNENLRSAMTSFRATVSTQFSALGPAIAAGFKGGWRGVFSAIGSSVAALGNIAVSGLSGFGSAIVASIRNSGLTAGIAATIGAGFRSLKSMAVSAAVGSITAPFRMAFGLISGSAASTVRSIAQVSSVMGGVQAAAIRASVPARSLAGAVFTLAAAIPRITMAAAKVAGIGLAISVPANMAAKSFAAAASEIVSKSKETGQSIQSLINEKYGAMSFITPDDIRAGAALSSSLKELKKSFAALWAQIGIAVAPALKQSTEFMTAAIGAVVRLASENRQLVATVVRVAGAVAGVAGAVGAAAFLFPYVSAGIAAVLPLINPFTVGIGAALYLFPQLREAAVSAISSILPNFQELGAVVNQTMGGIMKALQGGSMKLAAEILWAGLEVVWLEGTDKVMQAYRGMVSSIASAYTDADAAIRKGFQLTAQFFQDVWAIAVNAIKSTWMTAQNAIAGGFARVIAKMSGQDVNDVLATLNEMQGQESTSSNNAYQAEMNARDALTKKNLEAIEAERQGTQAGLKEELDARNNIAQQRMKDAKAALAMLDSEADRRKKDQMKRVVDGVRAVSSSMSSGFGSFSARTAGLQGVAGVGKLEEFTERTAKAAEETVAKLDKLDRGFTYA